MSTTKKNTTKNDSAQAEKEAVDETAAAAPTEFEAAPPMVIQIAHDQSGGIEATERYRAEALAIPRNRLRRFQGDIGLIVTNILRGATNLISREVDVVAQINDPQLEVFHKLLELAPAAQYTADEVARLLNEEEEQIKKLLPEATVLCDLLMKTLLALAAGGVINGSAVGALEKDRGRRGMARTCIAAAALFRKNMRVLKGKTIVTPEQVARTAKLGGDLLRMLPQRGKVRAPTPERERATLLRDGMFTLMLEHYDYARRVGGMVYGEERDERVPPPFAVSYARRTRDPVAVAAAEAQRAANRLETAKKKEALKNENAKAREEAAKASREADRQAREARKAMKAVGKKKLGDGDTTNNPPPGGAGAQANNT